MKEALHQAFSLTGLLWLSVSIIGYIIALWVNKKCKGHPLAHPIVVTALIVSAGLYLTETGVTEYQQAASLLHWLLGPITVALALPIYRQWQKLKALRLAVNGEYCFWWHTPPFTAWLTLFALDAPRAIQITMLAKSITTPLAMESSAQVGGIPALAAVFVIVTGVVGAIVATGVFAILNVQNRQAQGIAMGTVAHAIGTAKAIQMGEDVAAMATLGLCVNGIFTLALLSFLVSLFDSFSRILAFYLFVVI